MSIRCFLGTATAVAKVMTFTPANVEIGDVFTITLTDDAGHSAAIVYTAIAATVKDVVEGLKALAVAAKTAGTIPWTLCTATEDDAILTLTAATAGVPFYAATSAVNGGATDDQTLTAATPTANSGPSDISVAANWTGAAVPISSDEVRFENSDIDVLYGLNQSAVTGLTLRIAASFTGDFGDHSVAGSGYVQYGATVVEIGYNYGASSPSGSPRIKLDTGSQAAKIIVHDANSSPIESYLPTVRLKTNSATAELTVRKGRVGVACELASETSRVNKVFVSYVEDQANDADLQIGPGVTIDTGVYKTGGSCVVQAACPVLANYAGEAQIVGAGAVTTLELDDGTVYADSTGTITAANVNGGVLDMTRSNQARTVTTLNRKGAGMLRYDKTVVTVTNLNTNGPVELAAA